MNKSIIVVLFFLMLPAFTLQAQEDYMLLTIDSCLRQSNCECARNLYDTYKEVYGTNKTVEQRIAACKGKGFSTSKANPKVYHVGDTVMVWDYSGEAYVPYLVAYLDDSKQHGFAISISYDYTERRPYDAPEIDELKLIYKNRYVLGLRGEYWSSTHKEGAENCHVGFFSALMNRDYCKYYTFDFSTCKTHKRQVKNGDKYKIIYIKRF